MSQVPPPVPVKTSRTVASCLGQPARATPMGNSAAASCAMRARTASSGAWRGRPVARRMSSWWTQIFEAADNQEQVQWEHDAVIVRLEVSSSLGAGCHRASRSVSPIFVSGGREAATLRLGDDLGRADVLGAVRRQGQPS